RRQHQPVYSFDALAANSIAHGLDRHRNRVFVGACDCSLAVPAAASPRPGNLSMGEPVIRYVSAKPGYSYHAIHPFAQSYTRAISAGSSCANRPSEPELSLSVESRTWHINRRIALRRGDLRRNLTNRKPRGSQSD